jgi:hypothetical protein
MWTASEYLRQTPPRPLKYNVLQRANSWRYHNMKPRGQILDILA